MGFFQDVGHAISKAAKRVVANPARTLTTIGTFGYSEVLYKINNRAGNVLTNIYGGTVGGGVSGLILGGPAGAAAGAAAGLGKGIYGAVKNDSATKSLYQGAVYGAAAGSVAGAVYRTGAIGNVVSKFIPKAAAPLYGPPAPAAAAPGEAGFIGPLNTGASTVAATTSAGTTLGSTLGSIALLSLLQRPSGQPGSSVSPGDVSVVNPNSGGPGVSSPASGPWNYPAVSGTPLYDSSPIATELSSNNNMLLLFAGAGLFILFFVMRKHH
jgi:hypothetical protein